MDDLDAAFASRGWLAEQSLEFRSKILGLSRRVEFDRGEVIVSTGDNVGGFYGIASGTVSGWSSTDFADQVMGHIYHSGSWFGISSAVTGKKRVSTFIAHDKCTILHLPRSIIQPLIASDIQVAQRVSMLSQQLHLLSVQAATELLIRNTETRVAATLLRVTSVLEDVKPSDPRGFRLTQGELSEMSNASRTLTGHILAKFETLKFIKSAYGYIDIPNPFALADYVRSKI